MEFFPFVRRLKKVIGKKKKRPSELLTIGLLSEGSRIFFFFLYIFFLMALSLRPYRGWWPSEFYRLKKDKKSSLMAGPLIARHFKKNCGFSYKIRRKLNNFVVRIYTLYRAGYAIILKQLWSPYRTYTLKTRLNNFFY